VATSNERALFDLVIDGGKPDGTHVTDDEIIAAPVICHEHNQAFCGLLCVARYGRQLDGHKVGWEERERALDEAERMTTRPPTGRRP
jgi:hypothetical protein